MHAYKAGDRVRVKTNLACAARWDGSEWRHLAPGDEVTVTRVTDGAVWFDTGNGTGIHRENYLYTTDVEPAPPSPSPPVGMESLILGLIAHALGQVEGLAVDPDTPGEVRVEVPARRFTIKVERRE